MLLIKPLPCQIEVPKFNSAIVPDHRTKAFLDSNPSLRTVSLISIPDLAMGPAITFNKENAASELIRKFSLFSAGSERMIKMICFVNPEFSRNLACALVDKASENTIRTGYSKSDLSDIKFPVAGGRQAFIPLSDGTFIGLKGSGQYIEPDSEPYIFRASAILEKTGRTTKKWYGFVSRHEVEKLHANQEIINLAGEHSAFSQVIGYRSIIAIPDLDGKLTYTADLHADDLGRTASPHLVFYRTLSPLRLNKLPQILEYDPELKNTLNSLSDLAKLALGFEKNDEINIRKWLDGLVRQLARSEAFKAHFGLHKGTLHLQDINLAGQENDLEELVSSNLFPSQVIRATQIKLQMIRDVYNCLKQHGLDNQFSSPESYKKIFKSEFRAYVTKLESAF